MGGGKGNIKPEDGKQFEVGNNVAEKWTEKDALKLGNDLLDWMKAEPLNILFDEFFFIVCDESNYAGKIYSELPSYLANKFTSFLKILETCREIEKTKMKKYGLSEDVNPSMSKFLLSAVYGLSEKTDITSKGKELNNTTTIVFKDFENE